MRVVHISDCYLPRLGGIEQQVSGLARAQLAAGHEVHVVTATRQSELPEANIDGVQVHRLTAPLPFDLPLHPLAGKLLRQQLAQLQPDVVHVHLGSVSQFAWAGLRAAEALRLPTLSTVHSIWGPVSRSLYRWGRRWLDWPAGTQLSAVSTAAAQLVAQAAAAQVSVIGNGVDLAGWQAEVRAASPRLQLVCATRFSPRKRVLPLVLVMWRLQRQLGAECPQLTIAGSGSSWRWIRRLVAVLGLQEVLALPGRLQRPALVELYGRADLFVQVSVRESFGLAAVEARAAGLPVIGRAGNGFSEFVEHGVTGLLLPTDNAVVAAIALLHRDRAALASLRSQSAAAPPQQTWANTVQAVDRAYEAARHLL